MRLLSELIYKYKTKFISLLFFVSVLCFADSTTTLNFSYSIEAAACDVEINGGAGDQDVIYVQLGDIPSTELSKPGDATEWKNFSIDLKNCPETTEKYTAKFDGNAATADGTKYQNDGTATQVQLELQSQGGDVLDDDSTLDGDIVNSAATLKLRARAYSSEGGATGGGVHTAIQLTFTYS